MTAAEIKAGMVRGEWYDDTEGVYSSEQPGRVGYIRGYADQLAITTAVNATYGQGIDPEYVGRLYDALLGLCDDANSDNPLDPEYKQHLIEMLTAAKL